MPRALATPWACPSCHALSHTVGVPCSVSPSLVISVTGLSCRSGGILGDHLPLAPAGEVVGVALGFPAAHVEGRADLRPGQAGFLGFGDHFQPQQVAVHLWGHGYTVTWRAVAFAGGGLPGGPATVAPPGQACSPPTWAQPLHPSHRGGEGWRWARRCTAGHSLTGCPQSPQVTGSAVTVPPPGALLRLVVMIAEPALGRRGAQVVLGNRDAAAAESAGKVTDVGSRHMHDGVPGPAGEVLTGDGGPGPAVRALLDVRVEDAPAHARPARRDCHRLLV